MQIIRSSCVVKLLVVVALLAFMHAGKAQSEPDVLGIASKQVTALLSELADVHCIETVVQEKLAENGHILSSEREQFDYLIMIDSHEDDFQLNESRVEVPGWRHTHVSIPMLLSNGMATVLLVFHPYYRDGFTFELQPEEIQGGRAVIPIHFTHIPGRRTPAALALRGREYPLDLQGIAWFDKSAGAVVKVEASLLHDMSDVGLRSLDFDVEYKPLRLGADEKEAMMPVTAIVDVLTPHQHWRNTHYFGNYHGFSADAEQLQNIKIRNNDPDNGESPGVSSSPPVIEEKH